MLTAALFNSLGGYGVPAHFIEGLKRLDGDKKGIGCAVLQLSPDRSMKSQRDVRLLALPSGEIWFQAMR